jgi:predicted adenine nucleotide alpha hydrolase (AANH) superfamily ATPase
MPSVYIPHIGRNTFKDLYDIKYLVSDFKKKEGYKKSIDYSKEFNLYRQDYCGCKFSKYKS